MFETRAKKKTKLNVQNKFEAINALAIPLVLLMRDKLES